MKATIFVVLFFIVFYELKAAPLKSAARQNCIHKAEKSHIKDKANSAAEIDEVRPSSSQTVEEYQPAQTPCKLHSWFTATLPSGDFLARNSLMTYAYCDGSCDPPYSVDVRNQDYVTNDVLLRQKVDLTNIPISSDKKNKFKTPCCVPVAYTGLWVVNTTNEWMFLDKAIPTRCGCR